MALNKKLETTQKQKLLHRNRDKQSYCVENIQSHLVATKIAVFFLLAVFFGDLLRDDLKMGVFANCTVDDIYNIIDP